LIDLLSQSGQFSSKEEVTAFIKSQINWERYRDGVYIGIRYPVRQGGRQWAVFRLDLGGVKALAPARGITKKERKRLKRAAQFEQASLRLVPTHPVRHVDLFRRVGGVYPVEELRKKRVAIVGLGALGAPAALLLAKAGVGRFHLCDDDRLLVGNVTRHPSDLRDVPMPKCVSIFEKIKAINPFADVTRGGNITSADRAAAALRDADVAVVAIADESTELLIDSVALKLSKTTFYARAMQQMKVGRIIRVTPGEAACLVCLRRYREAPTTHRDMNGSSWIDVPSVEGGEVYDEGCGFAAFPGAAVDTEATANVLARTAVEWLLGRSVEANHWVLVNQPASDTDDPRLTSAPSCHRQTFLPMEECAACGGRGKEAVRLEKARADERRLAAEWRRVVLARDVYETIVREAAQCGRLETGGVLLGRADARERTLIITHATGPGPDAVHQEHHFLRDASYCQAEIDRVYAESGGSIDYVGEWHKHREAEPRLSETDRSSLVAIAASPSYQVQRPIMLICGMPDFLVPQAHKVSAWTVVGGLRGVETVPLRIGE
jgi:integrative and conjugative element protein (TIGR02256 family)